MERPKESTARTKLPVTWYKTGIMQVAIKPLERGPKEYYAAIRRYNKHWELRTPGRTITYYGQN